MPKLFLPIALMVLGTIKLPGEHQLSDAEAEHALEQLERLGHSQQATKEGSLPTEVTPNDALETLAGFLNRGEISHEEVAERLGFVIGMVVDEEEQEPAKAEPEAPAKAPEPIEPIEVKSKAPAKPEPSTELVIPPAVVKELGKAGFVLTKPETIQAADDEALLAVKGMTPELLARVRQITE